jgi:hypothetical protein
MTRDEITRMAREAGFVGMDGLHKGLCRFAALVAAAEREACAKIVDVYDYARFSEECAKAIRARGEKGKP